MKKVKSIKPEQTKFNREYHLQVGNFTITQGDIIKIEGEHGGKFKFSAVVTNTDNGKVWVDCFDVHKKSMGAYRSYSIDRVRRIPAKRGKQKKNVD